MDLNEGNTFMKDAMNAYIFVLLISCNILALGVYKQNFGVIADQVIAQSVIATLLVYFFVIVELILVIGWRSCFFRECFQNAVL